MAEELLSAPKEGDDLPTLNRLPSSYRPMRKFHLQGAEQKHYQQQYGDMYFYRLAMLKPAVEQVAKEAWADFEIGDEKALHKDKVLSVRQGELCWVVGTIYMDMPLKPNILEDISRDHAIAVPPPREKYLSPDGQDQIMLEDESGRLRLVGTMLKQEMLVTGCIVAVIGTENSSGEFEVLDLKLADLPRQPQRWELDDSDSVLTNGTSNKRRKSDHHGQATGGKIAMVSGLSITGEEADNLRLDMLAEYLLGEAGGHLEREEASKISRIVIAGNSIGLPPIKTEADEHTARKAVKKYGYDASAYNPAPTTHLDNFLATLLPSLPVTLIPGDSDPASIALPQQPIHPAMLPRSRSYMNPPSIQQTGWFDTTTNPWEGEVDGWRFLGTGGQPINDIFKYVEGDERLDMMENILRWRIGAPTAPDTLWCYPYQDEEPLVIEEAPHVYFAGNQPRYESTVIEGPFGQSVRIIALPKFKETGEIVLLSMDTLEPEVVKFDLFDEP